MSGALYTAKYGAEQERLVHKGEPLPNLPRGWTWRALPTKAGQMSARR